MWSQPSKRNGDARSGYSSPVSPIPSLRHSNAGLRGHLSGSGSGSGGGGGGGEGALMCIKGVFDSETDSDIGASRQALGSDGSGGGGGGGGSDAGVAVVVMEEPPLARRESGERRPPVWGSRQTAAAAAAAATPRRTLKGFLLSLIHI